MCGIAGTYGGAVTAEAAARVDTMLDSIAHRGPNGRGVVATNNAVLGHVRLAILDIEGGAQPFCDDTGQICLSFNGEIFNHIELRRELELKGHRFRTRSDTEVVLRLYLEKGQDCVHDMNGDFAFAIADARDGLLFMARDRMGVRPLYYTEDKTGLHFASEAKALIAAGVASGALDPLALMDIFTLWFPLPPRTVFAGVSELPPGHALVAKAGRTEIRRYWNAAYPTVAEDGADRRSEEDVSDQVAHLLREATAIRLRADVPVGSYLSGGLDSSIVSSLAAEQVSERLRTFSVTFENPEFDESAHQHAMVQRLGTSHSAIHCRDSDISTDFADVVRHAERPVLRTAPAPLYRLARFVRDSGYKVVLTGEGADEIFAGYDIFKEAKIRAFCARDPGSRLRPQLFRRLYSYLPAVQAQNPAYLNAFFGMSLDKLGDPLFSHLPRFTTTARLKSFFSGDLRAAIGDYDPFAELRDKLPQEFTSWHPLAQAQYLETAFLLPNYILSAQGDRVSMAHGVEGRFPFLDPNVVDYAARIPARMKLKGLREKHILKAALGKYVPSSVSERPKQPYRSPDSAAFFADGGSDAAAEALSEKALRDGGLFEPRAVAKLVAKCASGSATGFKDNMAYVGVLSTQLWSNSFSGNGRKTDAVQRPTASA